MCLFRTHGQAKKHIPFSYIHTPQRHNKSAGLTFCHSWHGQGARIYPMCTLETRSCEMAQETLAYSLHTTGNIGNKGPQAALAKAVTSDVGKSGHKRCWQKRSKAALAKAVTSSIGKSGHTQCWQKQPQANVGNSGCGSLHTRTCLQHCGQTSGCYRGPEDPSNQAVLARLEDPSNEAFRVEETRAPEPSKGVAECKRVCSVPYLATPISSISCTWLADTWQVPPGTADASAAMA
jgi:hypothetical protein